MNSLWRARKGTTLVEILVVMVVLLVGIMTVVVMFPTGFKVVRAAENQTIATKLAQAEVERWKNMPGNLPDDILPVDRSGQVLNDQNPGPGFDGMMPVTGSAGLFYPGNAGNYRKVMNETTPVPIASYFQTGGGPVFGSRYNLAFSPIELQNDPNNPGQYLGITVKSGDLLRRVGDSDSPIYLRVGQYGIDYTLGTHGNKPCFYMCFSYDRNPSHEYQVTYSYMVNKSSNGNAGNPPSQYLSQVDQVVHPDADGNWVPVDITVPPGYDMDRIDDGTDSCARGFAQVTEWNKDPLDPTDPYEFTVADSILGIVAFNPRAHNALERTARGVRAVTARISYTIYDTRIIREERAVAAPNEDLDCNNTNDHTQVKLALRFILNCGNPDSITDGDSTDNPDEPTFEGLVYNQLGITVTHTTDVMVPQAMLVIDLATGLRVELPGTPPSRLTTRQYPIDFTAGIVHLPKTANLIDWASKPVATNVELKGRHLRFFYRADGDWSVQCQKAHTYFLREYDKDKSLDYQHYRLFLDSYDNTWKLIFARCMSGQTVAVDYTYTDNAGVVHKVTGKNCRISDDTIMGAPCSYVVLGSASDISINPGDRIIVVGVSFRSRVIWRDGKTWRYVDIGTNLTRNSAP